MSTCAVAPGAEADAVSAACTSGCASSASLFGGGRGIRAAAEMAQPRTMRVGAISSGPGWRIWTRTTEARSPGGGT